MHRSVNDIDGIERLNKTLETYTQIEWMGTVDELLSGNHPYANTVRMSFREESQLPGNANEKHELQSLFEFLDTWGM